jgi:hypothetical protein
MHINKQEYDINYYKGNNIDFEFYLFENNINGSRLLSKYKNINFWLMVTNKTYNKEIDEIEQQINRIDAVIGSFRLSDIKEISYFENIEFL